MNAALGIVILVALPPALLVVSHVYAMATQDKKTWCVVLFDDRVRSMDKVMDDHRARFGIVVVQQWDAASKGYRASVAAKHVEALRRDRRVRIVQTWVHDEPVDETFAP